MPLDAPRIVDDAYRLIRCPDNALDDLCSRASDVRDRGRGRRVSFSPKVFIPLTRLCRDACSYCTFRQDPVEAERLYMTPEEVLAVARAGERALCTEALFTLGERPEQRYPEARDWLARRGYRSTLDYLAAMCALVLNETTLLPHVNPGNMTRAEMELLRPVSASMGLMLENVSERLCAPGGPHALAPSKHPRARLRTIELAGELRVAFTTGLLIGIGETPEEIADSLVAIHKLQERYGHIQEVIIQNFRAKPGTPMAGAPEPTVNDIRRTVAVARLVLGSDVNIQVPPNLSRRDYPVYLLAGINDWGGISPLTIDYVNPEAPWPQIADLRRNTAQLGFALTPRLPIYPEYLQAQPSFMTEAVQVRAAALVDPDGYVRGGVERYGA